MVKVTFPDGAQACTPTYIK